MLLPLAGALTVKAKFPGVAERTKPPLDRISNLSLILVIALLTVVNFKSVLEVFGTRGILAGLLLTPRPGRLLLRTPSEADSRSLIVVGIGLLCVGIRRPSAARDNAALHARTGGGQMPA